MPRAEHARWALTGEAAWLAVSVVLTAILAVVDLSLPSNANLSGALVIAPFFASVGSRPLGVVAAGLTAAAVGVGLAVSDGSGWHASSARLAVVLLGTLVATQVSRIRIRREHRLVEMSSVAYAAQRAIIRDPPSVVGGVAVASLYQSSAEAAMIGGDCYEALDTPFGTRLLIGDVRGHGLPSVRLAALTVGAFRALAYLEADLMTVAHELDMLARRYGAGTESVDGEEFVTAVLVEIAGSAVSIVNCGHPPPLLVGPGGSVEFLDARRPSLPLGLGAEPTADFFDLRPDARLLLYTDGLIEARDSHGRFFDLAAAGRQLAGGGLEDSLATLLRSLNAHAAGRVVDDVALLAIERRSPDRHAATHDRVDHAS